MYGFDVSNLISALKVSEDISWSSFFELIPFAPCGTLYTVDLHVRYGVTGAPSPSVTDHLVIIEEGQILHSDVMLIGEWGLSHPVSCTIKDSLGNVVFTLTKWITTGYWEIQPIREFFRDVSLPKGSYTVDWSVCGKGGSHYLTVSALPAFTTNDIDIQFVVTDTAGINAYAAWDIIKEGVRAELLVYNATVELTSAEIKGKYLVIFHLSVRAPPEGSIGSVVIAPIMWAVFLALIAVIAYEIFAVPAIEQRRIAQFAYNTTFYKFTYEECADMVWAEWTACMAATYPVVWNDIKDKIEAPKPPPPPPDLLTYIMYIVLAVSAIAGVYILVKYVMPALKGRR